MTGTTRCCSSWPMAIGSSRMTGAAMAVRIRPIRAMTWTPMPLTWRTWRQPSICSNAVHIGHSTGGGEVARYVANAEPGRVGKVALLGAIPPLMLKTDSQLGWCSDGGLRRLAGRSGRKSCPVFPRCPIRPVLRVQPGRRRRQSGPDPELVAAGHDGQCFCALSVHRGVFGNRPEPRTSRP